MLLHLITNSSPENTIGKNLVVGHTLNINLKRTTDIVAPEIVLVNAPGINYIDFNYAHIPMLGRYYFITNIESVGGSLWSLTLNCDVLETYSTGIKSSVAKYRRGIVAGDYHVEGLDYEVNSVITLYQSDVTLPDGVHTNVLTIADGGEWI